MGFLKNNKKKEKRLDKSESKNKHTEQPALKLIKERAKQIEQKKKLLSIGYEQK